MRDVILERSASALLVGVANKVRSDRFLAALLGVLVLAAVSCESASTMIGVDEPPDLSAAVLVKVEGDEQEAVVGASAAEPLVARVVDADGQAIQGAPVQWVFTQGQGRGMPSGAAGSQVTGTTDSEGLTQVEWTLGTRAGPQEATVEIVLPSAAAAATTSSVDGAAPPTDRGKKIGFTVNAKAASPDSIAVSPGAAQAEPGDTVEFDATVLDRYGNTVEDTSLRWRTSDESVAVVDETGMVTAVAEGSAEISARTGSVEGTAMFEVSSAPDGDPVVDRIEVSPTEVSLEVGQTQQLETSAFQANGDPIAASGYAWSSSTEAVATVSSSGSVTAVAEGTATITATLDGHSAESTVTVTSAAEDPVVDRIEINPSAVSLEVGQTRQLEASAFDASGDPVAASGYAWSTSNEAVATVDATGSVMAVGEGSATITATLDELTSDATFTVTPAPDFGEWDFVLEDTLVVGDVVVPDGETWLIGANVEVEGNVRTMAGTVAMRPGSSLKFVGADPNRYVGGGLGYEPQFADDIGLWIGHMGVLDIRGTPKQGWNRTGTHSTWDPDDEYWIAPTDVGDHTPRRWFPGDPIPQVDPRVPAAEVVNVTRDIVIEGPGHIHIHSQRPQRIEYVRIEAMGVLRSGGPVLGRYALHMHHGGDGTRGTLIQGVALVDSRGRGYVPHESHGITMIDNVAVNTWADALWWDKGDDTNDLLVDRMAIIGVNVSREINGELVEYDAFTLGSGFNMEIRNSVAAGVRGSKLAVGFAWLSGGQAPNPVWVFDTGNVAHNNRGPGLRFWTNLPHEHPVRDYISYRNQEGGIENGAYENRVSYTDVVLIDDHFFAQANSNGEPVQLNENIVIQSPREAIRVGHRKLGPTGYSTWVDCELSSGEGYPLVYVTDAVQPWHAHFIRCGIEPDDIEFESYGDVGTGPDVKGSEGSRILIDHVDGRKWEIRIENNQRIVVER